MEREMRVFGLTLPELFLEDLLNWLGWILVLFGILSRVFPALFGTAGFSGGLVFTLTILTGFVLILASAGIRQNRAALDLGFALFPLLALAWLVHGIITGSLAGIITGIVLVPLYLLVLYLRALGIQARFKPRFFSLRQFETVIQVADTMIDSDGEAVLHPIQIAINIDHFLSKFDSPTAEDIRSTLNIVEWLLPMLTLGRPFPFSSLGSHERRRSVEKVIGSKLPIFKDVARFLKLLSSAGYYGSQEGMAQVGFKPFDERERAQSADQTPLTHTEPV